MTARSLWLSVAFVVALAAPRGTMEAQAIGGMRFGAAAVAPHATAAANRALRPAFDSVIARSHGGAVPSAIVGAVIGGLAGYLDYRIKAGHANASKSIVVAGAAFGAAIGYFIGY